MKKKNDQYDGLPGIAAEYIWSVARRVGNTRRVRREVVQELCDHFRDALRDCTDEAARAERAKGLIEQFGDVKTLGRLIRRGKKRCRPLWRKTLVWSVRTVWLTFLLCCLYTVWLCMGTPTITTDYLSIINANSRPKAPESENAWPHYKRAIELYVKPAEDIVDIALLGWEEERKSFATLTVSQQAGIEQWIRDNESAREEFVAGSRKPHFWIPLSLPAGQPMYTLEFPDLLPVRSLGALTIWRSDIALNRGRPGEALEYSLVSARVGAHLQRQKVPLFSQFIGMLLSRHANKQILRIAASPSLDTKELPHLQRQLKNLFPEEYPLFTIGDERLGTLDTIQRCYTRGGLGGGHLIPERYRQRMRAAQPNYSYLRGAEMLEFQVMLCAGRDETVALANQWHDHMDEQASLTPYERRIQGESDWEDEFIRELSGIRHPVLRALLPQFTGAGEETFRTKALHEAMITVLALRRWRLEKSEYPESLDQLVAAGYLQALPADPYSDDSLKYERRGEDFILYSLGRDCEDDGGRRTTETMRKQNDIADYVIWPVRDLETLTK